MISLNPAALEEADRLDATFKTSGFVGPLHGIPVIVKDQGDVKGMPTTLGSALFKDYMPERDCFVVAKLQAGRRDLPRQGHAWANSAAATRMARSSARRAIPTISSAPSAAPPAAPAAAVSANFCTVAVGQEGFASIRRPSIWNGVAGMRPTTGPGQPGRRLWRLADHQRLARTDGAHRHRSCQAAGRMVGYDPEIR